MVQKITWSRNADLTFDLCIAYLREHFSEIEVIKFAHRIQQKLLLIEANPRIGNSTSKKPNVHRTVIHKRVLLIYQYKPLKKEIILLEFWNTLQNPGRLKL